MAENVLRRRDEYEEKKEHRYGVVKRTAAIAVTVVFVLSAMIVGPIVGRIMKEQQNQPADGTKINTDTETTADQDTITTETADVTTEVGETTGETDISEKYIILKKAEEKHSPDITNGLNIELKDIIEESEKQSFNINDGDMIGVLHSDVCRYELQMFEDYNEDYEKWVVLILPDDNIEMVSPKERYFYHENDKTEKYQSVNIEFRYKAGKTNGSISVYMFAGDYGIKRFEDNFKGVENPIISTSNSLYDVMETYYFAQIKGYDCWSISCTYIYQQAAIYFGDVDDNGVPLYMKNPYLEDYYDNPWCEEKRDEESNRETTGETDNNQNTNVENEIQLFEFVSPNAPKFESDVFDSYDKPMKYTKMYAYDEKDIMEYNVKVNVKEVFNMRNPDYKFSKLKVYVAHDENVEILTGKYQEFDMSSGDAEFKLSFRYINGAKNEMFLLFYSTDKDAYYNDLNETTVLKNGFDTNGELNRRYQMFAFCTIRLKGYDFTAAIAYQNLVMNMYKSVAYYFNDVDANNRPLYLDNPTMEGYSDSPWCKSILNPTDPLENEEIREKIREYFDTADDKTKQDIEGILEEYETSKQ